MKRYRRGIGGMVSDEDGEWVRWVDVEELPEKIAKPCGVHGLVRSNWVAGLLRDIIRKTEGGESHQS